MHALMPFATAVMMVCSAVTPAFASDNSAVAGIVRAVSAITKSGKDQPGSGLEVRLPKGVTFTSAKLAADAMMVYRSSIGVANATVQALTGGVTRVQTVTPNSSGSHKFTSTFGAGQTPEVLPDGSAIVVGKAAGADAGYAMIQQPWAKDAGGSDIAVSR